MSRPHGYKVTEETKAKLRAANLGKQHSFATREKLRRISTGKSRSLDVRRRISATLKGRVIRPETRLKLSLAQRGERAHSWRGGVSQTNNRIRRSVEYKLWREAVYKRDDYTCVFCRQRGGRLQADHIKPFAYFPELRFSIDNGRTLCEPCHKTTDTYGRPKNKEYGR